MRWIALKSSYQVHLDIENLCRWLNRRKRRAFRETLFLAPFHFYSSRSAVFKAGIPVALRAILALSTKGGERATRIYPWKEDWLSDVRGRSQPSFSLTLREKARCGESAAAANREGRPVRFSIIKRENEGTARRDVRLALRYVVFCCVIIFTRTWYAP